MGRWSCFRPVTLELPPSHAKLVRPVPAVRTPPPCTSLAGSPEMLRVLAPASANRDKLTLTPHAQDEPCQLLALPEPVLQLILDGLPGNEALAVGASCRALQEAVRCCHHLVVGLDDRQHSSHGMQAHTKLFSNTREL